MEAYRRAESIELGPADKGVDRKRRWARHSSQEGAAAGTARADLTAALNLTARENMIRNELPATEMCLG